MNYYQQHQSEFLEGLKAFLRIPSISALSEHKPDILRAAEFARERAARGGADGRADRRRAATRWSMPNGWARRASRPFCSTGTTTCSRPIRWTSGSRRRSSPKFAATTSSPAAPCDDKGQVLHPDQGRGRPDEDHRQAAGEREVPAGRRRGNRRRAHRSVREDQAAAAEGRCGGGVRHRDVRAGSAHHLRRPARHGVLRARSCRAPTTTCIPASTAAPRPTRCRPSPRSFARSKTATGTFKIPGFYDRVIPPSAEGARGLGAAAVRRKGVHGKGNGRARAGGRAGRTALRAHLGAANPGSARHPRRLHRRRRQDRDSGPRRWPRSAPAWWPTSDRRSRRAIARGHRSGLPAGCHRGVEGAAVRASPRSPIPTIRFIHAARRGA